MAEQLGRAELVLELNDKALRQGLEDLKRDIANVSASINPRSTGSGRSGGGRGVATPAEVDRLTQLARELNLNTNWGKALAALQDVDTDLRLIAAGTEFNVNESWRAALAKLDEIDSDLKLVSGGEQLNLNTSWGKFLAQLQGVKADIDAATRQSANSATRQQIRARIQQNRQELGGFGAASRDNFGSTPATIRDIFDDDLARVRAARVRQEQTAADITRLTAQSEQRAAKAFAAASAARTRRLTEAASNAVIGGAFPALFGQGAGASLGGGLGGALGGLIGGQFGFGLSLVGTALGSAFDALNLRFKEVADALQSPIKSFEKLREVSLLASDAQESYVQALIDAGRTAEATQVIQAEAGRTIDPGAALLLAGSSDELNRSFSDLQDTLSNFTSGAGAGFNDWLAKLIKTVGAAPTESIPLTGPSAITSARQQQNNSGALLGLGGALLLGAGALISAPVSVPLLATAGIATAGLGLTGAGVAGIKGGRDREAVATSKEVAAAEQQIQSILERQAVTQEQLNVAKAAGANKTAELLQLSSQFQDADVSAAQKRLQVETQLAAGQIDQATALERLFQIDKERATIGDTLLSTQRAAAAESERQFKDTQQLIGLYGEAKQIREEELKIAKAKRDLDSAGAVVSNLSPEASQRERDATLAAQAAAANDYNRILIEGQRRIRDLENQRWAANVAAANQIASIQEDIAIQQQRPGLTVTGVGALQSIKALEDAIRAEQNAQAALRASPGDTALFNAAQLASQQVKLASEKTKADLLDAYEAAQRSVQSISRSIEDAVTALDGARGGAGGINRFIDPQQARTRQEAANTQLFATANQLANALGVVATFSGSLTQRNSQLEDFIRSARQELRAPQDINQLNDDLTRSQNDLVKINDGLLKVNEQLYNATSNLASSTEALANKDWNVYVSVPGGSATGDVTRPGIF